MNASTALAPLRALELTDAEIRAVLERRDRRRSRRRFVISVAAPAAAVVAIAVPTGGAELVDGIRAFLEGGDPPGRTIELADLPKWLRDTRPSAVTVVAEADGERLLAFRQESGAICFDFGSHVGICDFTAANLFDNGPVALFGPTGPDEGGGFRLWGLALQSIERVEIELADGSVRTVPVSSGFGVRLDADQQPLELRAYAEGPDPVQRIDLRERWSSRPAL